MNKIGNWLYKHIYDVVLWVIGILNVLPIIAPMLAHFGINFPAKVIYWVYSFFCHQLHWRSLHVCDHQYGWCSRCTFIWLNILLTGIFVKFFKIKKIKWYWYGVFIIPVALDGIIQTVATLIGLTTISDIYYMSNNFIRMFTGSIFGIGFGLFVWQNLLEGEEAKPKGVKQKNLNILLMIVLLLIFSVTVYFIAVWVWDITSVKYGPNNLLDFAVKTPQFAKDFLIRRLHGID